MSTTRTLARLLFVAALGTGGAIAASAGATSVAAPTVQTFECTGDAQSWVVPANVTSATFEAWGAQGGVGDDGSLERPSADAGLGGHTTATIAVTPGETIQINVGCAGSDSLGNAGAPGGFGGSPGGDGGVGGDLGTGGGGGGTTSSVDTIKVSKCYYFDTGSYVEMLMQASSSDSTAHLYAYLPSGQYLGEVQNGGGGRYGGTVFLTFGIPAYITIISSSGGRIDAPTSPLQL